MQYARSQYEPIADLESHLGDTEDALSPFSFARAVENDEKEEFPAEAVESLQRWGFGRFSVPVKYGGKLTDTTESLRLVRAIARRDLTLAVAQGQTFLGTAAIWAAGTPSQKDLVSGGLIAGDQAAMALTEEAHGADIRASEVVAEETDGGYLISGTKWLINNGTRARFVTLFAKLVTRDGKRVSACLFLIDKQALDPGTFRHLEKIRTHGIRGADISGIQFNQSWVAANCMIGTKTDGLRTTLRCLFLTRTLCAGLSLGAADTALRTAFEFASERRLYGKTAIDIPYVERLIAQTFALTLLCEATSVAAARALHTTPSQASIWSSVVKYFVPTTIERVLNDLSIVCGARHYLRKGLASGIFQKMLRDNAVVSLFDGSTGVNLQNIASQLYSLSVGRTKVSRAGISGAALDRLLRTLKIDVALPELCIREFDLVSRGANDALDVGPIALTQSEAGHPECSDQLQMLAKDLHAAIQAFDALIIKSGPTESIASSERFEAAKKFCTLHALVVTFQFCSLNRSRITNELQDGEWLILAARTLLNEPNVGTTTSSGVMAHRLVGNMKEMSDRNKGGRWVSLLRE